MIGRIQTGAMSLWAHSFVGHMDKLIDNKRAAVVWEAILRVEQLSRSKLF